MDVPSLDDFLAIQDAYNATWDRGKRMEFIRQLRSMFEDLVSFSARVALSGYDMREWRRKLFVPFDAEFNRIITVNTGEFEVAQRMLTITSAPTEVTYTQWKS